MRERRISCFVRFPRTPSARIVTLARMSTPGSNVLAFLAVAADATVARSHADDAVSLHQQLGAGKPGKHVDAFRLDEARKPLAELLQRDDVVAVIPKRRRRDRKFDLAGLRKEVDAIFAHLRRKRRALGLEIGNQLCKRARIEHRSRQQMRAGLGGLLEHRDAQASCRRPSAAARAAAPPTAPPARRRRSEYRRRELSRSLISRISPQRREGAENAFSSESNILCVSASLR